MSPAIEAGIDGSEHFVKCGEVAVVRGQSPGQFPDPLDRRELGTVRRQKQQLQMWGVLAQERSQERGMVITGVVEYDDDMAAGSSMAQ